jgi:hypothetical protein
MEFNFADGEREYELLLERIRNVPAGRHYFNARGL